MNANVNNNYGNNNNNNFNGGTNSNVPTNNWAGNTNTGGSDPYNMNQDNNQPKVEVCNVFDVILIFYGKS